MMIDCLAGNRARPGKLRTAGEIDPRLVEIGLRRRELSARLADVGVASADLRGQRTAVGCRLRKLAASLQIFRSRMSPLRTICVLTTATSVTAAETSGVTCAESALT